MHAPDPHPVEALFDKVLGSYERRPVPEDLARLTDELLATGAELLVVAEPLRATDPRVMGAVRDWHKLTSEGPAEDSPFGSWNYARALARVVRTLHRQIEISRQPVQPRADSMFFSFGRMPL